jgi:hypothetical protein
MLAALRLRPEPARGQDSKEVSAGEQQHGAVDGFNPFDDAVRPRRNLIERFPPGNPSRNISQSGRFA